MSDTTERQASGDRTERKLRVGVIFGGRSGEHEVSIMSASSVLRFIDRDRFEVVPIGITKEGKWVLADNAVRMLERGVVEPEDGSPAAIVPQPGLRTLVGIEERAASQTGKWLDVVFPVLHGTYGEDGTVQGLLELADIPYVGAGVLASAVGMDKDVMKRVFRERGLPVVEFASFLRKDIEADPRAVVADILSRFGIPVFVKPANLGSSVGVTKVKNPDDLATALREAAQYDRKIVVEKALENVREIECSVLGNEDPVASVPGEVIPSREFYDYTAKYLDRSTRLVVPAELPPHVVEEIRRLSVEAFKAIDCSGMARVDFFVERKTERVYVNEINTIPGFTHVSMYPKMWEASGLSYTDLITRLIELAIERHEDKSRRRTSYGP